MCLTCVHTGLCPGGDVCTRLAVSAYVETLAQQCEFVVLNVVDHSCLQVPSQL